MSNVACNRQYARLNSSFTAAMNIKQVYNYSVKSRTSIVRVEDIGLGGLCFQSTLNFPVDQEVLLEFNTVYGTLSGHIVWKKSYNSSFMYGMQFSSVTPSLFLQLNPHRLKFSLTS